MSSANQESSRINILRVVDAQVGFRFRMAGSNIMSWSRCTYLTQIANDHLCAHCFIQLDGLVVEISQEKARLKIGSY